MDFRERRKWLRDIRTAIIILVLAVAAFLASQMLLKPKYSELKTEIADSLSVAQKISTTVDETSRYIRTLSTSGKKFENLQTEKDKCIEFLGTVAQKNQLNINKMTADDVIPAGRMSTMQVDIELQGSLYNVKNFVQQMYDSEIVSRINSFSYRLQGEDSTTTFPWMWRAIDNDTLVPWWNITGDEEPITYVSSPEENVKILNADTMMRHGTALCYLQVEFIGSGGY